MKIWKKSHTLEQLNRQGKDCAIAHLGIEITEQGDNYLKARMPVDHRTIQPYGFLHGGLSAALAESVGSLAGFCSVEDNKTVVGVEINASHLRPVRSGYVTATAKPVRLGTTLQVWQIDIHDQDDKLCCTARLTLSVINFNG